jgi:pullulanase/glycogen debranching enzyme
MQANQQFPLFVTFFLLILNWGARAQVTTDLSFPSADQPLTITFDAAQGSQGLINYTGDVYAHTGVITSLSSGGSDWKYVVADWTTNLPKAKMTRTATNTYTLSITPSIKGYYGVPEGEEILQMAFVFRSSDGTKTGKTDAGGDIFVTVYSSGLSTSLSSPTSSYVILNSLGQTIPVTGQSSQAANLALYDNGSLVASAANATTLSHTITANDHSTHKVNFIADNGTTKDTSSFIYLVANTTAGSNPPASTEWGITYPSSTSARLYLYAPNKQHVFVLGDFNDWTLDAAYQMTKTTDGNAYWIDIPNLTAGQEYAFQYLVDGTLQVSDPYAEKVLDPWNDQYIPASVYPNLKAYPAGKGKDIVSILQPGQTAYSWQVTNFQRPANTDLVIYELLLRDFIAKHDYNTLKDTLDYLERLGVNAIELMPVNEFSGNESWGYNPSFHMALDKYYGTKDDFKAFIDECHSRGIAVIVDVVYNHIDGYLSPLGRLYWNDATNKPTADNPWLNVDAPHPFGFFSDINHESAATQQYLDRVMKYWIGEYKLDGFRFDLSKGFTQVANTDVGAWGNYDASRVAILKRISDVIRAVDNDFYIILEHLGANNEELELANYGMMLWGNLNHAYSQCAMGYTSESDLSWASYKTRGWTTPNVVTYMESHDEERLMYKNKAYGNSGTNGYSVKNINTGLKRVALASTFFYTIPGPKMLWQFGELGYDYSINTCADGTTISNDCRVSNKPIRWDYYDNDNRKALYDITRDLIYLKKQPAFSSSDFSMRVGAVTDRWIKINDSDMNVLAIGNFDVNQRALTVTFQNTGTWYEFFSGETFEVANTTQSFTFQAGEYRIYTTKRVERPSGNYGAFTSIFTPKLADYKMIVQPNPSSGLAQMSYTLPEAAQVRIEMFDIAGRKVAELQPTTQRTSGEHALDISGEFANGSYFIRLTANGKIDTQKFVVIK